MSSGRVASTALIVALTALVLLPSIAPATVEEQRARLPPPATCQDPIEGIWMSHKYEAPWDEWMIFTLEIRRAPGVPANPPPGSSVPLVGRIQAHAWFGGGPQASSPPPCGRISSHWIVEMTAAGTVVDRRLHFWGTRWWVGQVFCGSRSFGYNLDHFSGVVDDAMHEFQSVNNDGGRAVNDPTVFRRVRCLEPQSPPHPYVSPPSYQLPRRSGCAR